MFRIYKYNTNDVNTINDVVEGNIYKLDLSTSPLPQTNQALLRASDVYVDDINYNSDYYYNNEPNRQFRLVFNTNGSFAINFYLNGAYSSTPFSKNINDIENIYFVYISDLNSNYLDYVEISDFNEIKGVETHNVSAQDVFYNSLDNVANSPLFTWAKNSFLGVPVSYLGGIFGLASNSVINILLCYWVAISIIWLMFDVLMFVPMLVHKSIDKARF